MALYLNVGPSWKLFWYEKVRQGIHLHIFQMAGRWSQHPLFVNLFFSLI